MITYIFNTFLDMFYNNITDVVNEINPSIISKNTPSHIRPLFDKTDYNYLKYTKGRTITSNINITSTDIEYNNYLEYISCIIPYFLLGSILYYVYYNKQYFKSIKVGMCNTKKSNNTPYPRRSKRLLNKTNFS